MQTFVPRCCIARRQCLIDGKGGRAIGERAIGKDVWRWREGIVRRRKTRRRKRGGENNRKEGEYERDNTKGVIREGS